MNFDPDTLRNGSSYYDGQNTLYYRGDGAHTTVALPEGKVLERVSPPQYLTYHPSSPEVLAFERAVPLGELVTITLNDAD